MQVLHGHDTPETRAALIALEELALPYETAPPGPPALGPLNPLGVLPVLLDDDAGAVIGMETILWHLATRTGRLLGEGRNAVKVMEWLLIRPDADAARVLQGLEAQLAASRYLAGEFSIADIAWVSRTSAQLAAEADGAAWPAVRTWMERCTARPSVEKGLSARLPG